METPVIESSSINPTTPEYVRRVVTRRSRMSPAEKKEAQKVNALKHYHRKKALTKFIDDVREHEKEIGELIEVEVKYKSRVLGNVHEIITYRVYDFDEGLFHIESVTEIITEMPITTEDKN